MITLICCICESVLGHKEGGEGLSHGYCRKHELEALINSALATPSEVAEYRAIK